MAYGEGGMGVAGGVWEGAPGDVQLPAHLLSPPPPHQR